MIVNTNIENAINNKQNNFLNSYFEQNTESFANCFIIDVHPLYGYEERQQKYVWSFGYYLYNLFMFSHFNENSFSFESKWKNKTKNKITSYYIIYGNDSFLSKCEENEIIKTIQLDIIKLKKEFPDNIIKIYSCKENKLTKKKFLDGIFMYTEFDLINVLKESDFLVTNKFSQIFCIAYLYNVKVICTQDDVFGYYNNFFFFNYQNVYNDDVYIYNNIGKYLKYIDHFSLYQPHDICTNCIYNIHFKRLNETTSVCLPYMKETNNISEKRCIYVHHEAKHLYNVIQNGVDKSILSNTKNVNEDSIIIFFMSENRISKQLLLEKQLPVITFDDNIFIMKDSKHDKLFCRYYIKNFKTITLIQENNRELFYFSKTIKYNHDGIILCILDNSKGLFYNNNTKWFEYWSNVLRYLSKIYNNNQISVKLHKNDYNNIYREHMNKEFTIHIEEDSVDNLLKKKIKFCVIHNGSSYIKCVQNGVMVKSNKYDLSEGIFDLENKNILEELEIYKINRDEIFDRLLNKIVSLDNIKNGHFFNKVIAVNNYNNLPDDI